MKVSDRSSGKREVENLRIAYCEDEGIQAAAAEDVLKKAAEKLGLSCKMDLFSRAEQLLFALDGEKTVPYDLVLLDIRMAGLDGFTLAARLRQWDKKVRLAFLTSDPSHVFAGYELAAWRYMLKPLTGDQAVKLLEDLETELTAGEASVLIEIAGERRKIYLDELLYLEVCGHYTTLYCTKESVAVKHNFSAMMKIFREGGANLAQCHRSVAVNVEKLVRITRQSCCLSNGTELPVSRGMYKKLNEAFIQANAKKQG